MEPKTSAVNTARIAMKLSFRLPSNALQSFGRSFTRSTICRRLAIDLLLFLLSRGYLLSFIVVDIATNLKV